MIDTVSYSIHMHTSPDTNLWYKKNLIDTFFYVFYLILLFFSILHIFVDINLTLICLYEAEAGTLFSEHFACRIYSVDTQNVDWTFVGTYFLDFDRLLPTSSRLGLFASAWQWTQHPLRSRHRRPTTPSRMRQDDIVDGKEIWGRWEDTSNAEERLS